MSGFNLKADVQIKSKDIVILLLFRYDGQGDSKVKKWLRSEEENLF